MAVPRRRAYSSAKPSGRRRSATGARRWPASTECAAAGERDQRKKACRRFGQSESAGGRRLPDQARPCAPLSSLLSVSLASGCGDFISFSQSLCLMFASGNGLHLQILVTVQRLWEERMLQMLIDICNSLHLGGASSY